ncbi:hypothetical protein ACLIMP_04225 [Novosphingobium aerophilum]|uniref:hypothetical protein n=1 Tax=Novosphingobium aerophilum TaxID=2839843 RepID=UPI003FD63BC8
MTDHLAIVAIVSIAASGFGYWRVLRLHLRMTALDPKARPLVSHVLDYLTHRKERRHD